MSPRTLSGIAVFALFWVTGPSLASPEFAEPPPDARPLQLEPSPDPTWQLAPPSSSWFRLSVGPAVRVLPHAAGGLLAAIDFGSRGAGARLSGTWVRTGGEHGLSQYAAELWIDFDAEGALHPIVAAGAGVAEVRAKSQDEVIGVGLFRASLEYRLPIRGADARAGIDLTGAVPAIHGEEASDPSGWLLAAARVGVGF